MNKLSLFKRYTPPTCTLSIYNQASFLPFKSKSLDYDYSYELIFDDPRSPNQDNVVIKGDRPSLEKLRNKVNLYINNYLENTNIIIKQEEHKTEQLGLIIQLKTQLHHQIKTSLAENIILTHTQLLDLINALDSFYSDFIANNKKNNSVIAPFKLGMGISAIALMLIGLIWWQNETTVVEESTEEIETRENNLPTIAEVEPPIPLNRENLPSLTLPDVPENLLENPPIPPLSNDISQAPGDFDSNTSITPIPNPDNLSNQIIPAMPSNNSNQLIIPPPPQEIAPAPEPLPPLGSVKPNLPTLPILEARNPQNNTTLPNIPEGSQTSPSDRTQQEIKEYFSTQWQPPETLTQSIEYRLLIGKNGSIARVTPIGQAAKIYLDRTPIPLQGEEINSPFTESETITIRLILNPNGNVATFQE